MRGLAPRQRALLRIALVAAVLSFIIGGLAGYLQPPVSLDGKGTGPGSITETPDIAPAVALAAVDRYGHWGDAHQVGAEVGAAEGLDLGASFQLVGVEQREHEQVALLLFVAGKGIPAERLEAPPDTDNILRLQHGEQLLPGVRVAAVTAGSITLVADAAAGAGKPATSEMPSWTLRMYAAPAEQDQQPN